jgi:hypothetical protein
MASPCGSLVSSWYKPPRTSRHPSSYSNSAATWTSCGQPWRHAIHPRLHSSTRTSGTRTTCSCGKTPFAAPWNHLTAARMHKTFKIVVRGQVTVYADRIKPAYILGGKQHDTGSPQAQPRSTPVKRHATTTTGSANYTLRAHRTLPGSLQNLSPVLRRG